MITHGAFGYIRCPVLKCARICESTFRHHKPVTMHIRENRFFWYQEEELVFEEASFGLLLSGEGFSRR